MLKYIFILSILNFAISINEKELNYELSNENLKNVQIDLLLPSLIFFSVFLFYISAIIHTNSKKFYLLMYRKKSFEEYEFEENEKLIK